MRDGAIIAIQSTDQMRHVHSLYSFPSKFFPELPRWAVEFYSKKGDTVLDPFGGSGTTAVEALISGRNAVSLDINPFATLLASAKTVIGAQTRIQREEQQLLEVLSTPDQSLPEAVGMKLSLDSFWFDLSHLRDFARIRQYIECEIGPKTRPFWLAVLASTIKQFSYLDLGQIKVKRDAKKLIKGTISPFALFNKRVPIATERYIEFSSQVAARVKAECYTISAGELAPFSDKIDLIVTSPPYINAMNYSMAMRYELLLLGLISEQDFHMHQEQYFGTERVYANEYNNWRVLPSSWSCATWLDPVMKKVFLGEKKRWFICYDYFLNMRESFEASITSLKANGYFVLVAGTNTIKGQYIDTFRVLCSMLEDLGLKQELSFKYEIIKQKLKITRHETARLIAFDGVAVFKKTQ